jgi:predicted nucleotidyltransferase
MNTGQVINKAKQFVKLVSDSGIPVTSAYLYGSYAKGLSRPDSDIDICIVSQSLGNDTIDEMVKLSRIAREVDMFIEPYPMSPADFAEKYNLLAHEIRTYGIQII